MTSEPRRTRPIVAPAFGARLLALRGKEGRGTICKRLAQLGLSLDRSTLLQYERGTVGSPDPVILWALGQIYHVSLESFVLVLLHDRTGRPVVAGDVLARAEKKARRTPSTTSAINYEGTLLMADMVRVLKTSDNTIRRGLQAGTFPIPPLQGIDNRLRWSGPVVKRWLEKNGPLSK